MAITRERCWRCDWVVEFDIKAAFDQPDHGLLIKAVLLLGRQIQQAVSIHEPVDTAPSSSGIAPVALARETSLTSLC